MTDKRDAPGKASKPAQRLGLALEELAGLRLAPQDLEKLYQRLAATKRALAGLKPHVGRDKEPILSLRLEEAP